MCSLPVPVCEAWSQMPVRLDNLFYACVLFCIFLLLLLSFLHITLVCAFIFSSFCSLGSLCVCLSIQCAPFISKHFHANILRNYLEKEFSYIKPTVNWLVIKTFGTVLKSHRDKFGVYLKIGDRALVKML